MIVVSHPTGNRNVRALLAALHESGLLGCFHVTLALARDARWPRLLPAGVRGELERRRYELPARLLRRHPAREAARLVALRAGWTSWTRHETGWASVDQVYADLDRRTARDIEGRLAVYAYEDGAAETFARAAEVGTRRIYELPIAYWETLRGLLREESERLPAWAATLGGGLDDSPAKLERKTRELELAELVVTPSRFVADSLPAWARSKRVVQSPFGSPSAPAPEITAAAEAGRRERARRGLPLRVLFVGSMSQRKGLGDLMAAVRRLDRRDVELVAMGSLQAEPAFYARECPGFRHEPGRPHAAVLELMSSCDVFCLPSIVEGRALVMQEAMSRGLPVVITPNTGGADLMEERGGLGEASACPAHGRFAAGFLVPVRSPEAIAEALAWCADHRAAVWEMGRAARTKAAEYSWDAYGGRIVEAIRGLLDLR